MGDEFHFTYKKLKDNPYYKECDIVHLHNIHGSYFDIESLLLIAKDKYIVWTLHDMWIMTGGEAYTFENNNYQTGIGTTPYIANYPLNNPVIDRRQHFLQKKKSILKQFRSYLF